MTIAEVRKAAAPLTLERTSDGEGIALISVMKGETSVMTLYAGEEDRDANVDENATVEQIWVWDRSYKTTAGVYPGMPVSEAETRLGKVKRIVMSEIESREFAEFSNHQNGVDFRLLGKDAAAGDYPPESNTATAYTPGAYIFSINVTGRGGGNQDSETTYTISSTDLRTECNEAPSMEGGHVSTFCKGPGNYQIHYFDAATVYQINVATDDREWEQPIATIGLDKLAEIETLEWRLADGEPFAVLMTMPGSDKVVVRGLKGFERIKYEETGRGALARARSMADNDHEDIIVPSTPLDFGGSTQATVSGRIENVRDKLKYVLKASAGDRLTVTIDAKKWAGEEGPIMVGIVTMPDGSSDGAPGGTVFDSVLTQSGDYEILVYQNAAKSQTEQIDVAVTVTLTPAGLNTDPAIGQTGDYQPMDAAELNRKLVDGKSANIPLQITSHLVGPFADMLSRTVTIEAESVEQPGSLTVVVTDDGLADDSVRGIRYKFHLKADADGTWQVDSAFRSWRCHEGRGQQNFSSKPCI
jgi:hypothetical protein